MKKFLIKNLFFALPFMVFLFEGFLPINAFTYRPWESLVYNSKKGIAYPFYPDQKLKMHSTGDLRHHTKYAITKNENWITDKLGYRNDTFIGKPKILLIGDSFIAGSGLPQDSTITNLLKTKLNQEVYNLAPASFNDFISLMNNNAIKRPELVVYGIVERTIPSKIMDDHEELIRQNSSQFFIFIDKLIRLYSLNYIKARIKGKHGYGVQGEDTTMYFLKGKNQKYKFDKLDEGAQNIISYKKFCDSIGANFVFLPLPNKETVYFEKVPLDCQPEFICELNSTLNQNGVITVNTLELFNNNKGKERCCYYHLDDTHWNAKGVNLVVDDLIKTARTHDILPCE